MWRTNIRVLAVGFIVIGFYTMVARVIPQVESAVPERIDLSGDVSPEALVTAGENLFSGAGACTACHGLGTRAPNLRTDHAGSGTIGQRCGDRPGYADCKAYLYEALTEPGVFLVEGFPGIMPDARRQLDDGQIWAIVAYLQSLGGTVTVTSSDLQAAPAASAAPAAAPAFAATTDPVELLTLNACVGCHAMDGPGPPIGPSFDGMGARRTAAEIRRGILDPNAEIAEGFEPFAGTMPANFGEKLSAAQLEAIVSFLAARR